MFFFRYWAATLPSLIIVAYVSWFIYYLISILVLSKSREILAEYNGN